MLKVFRKKGVTKKVLWVVAGIIIISFAFGFGVSRYGEAFSLLQTAGKVYGKPVSLKEFQRNYQNVRDQAIMMHGANIEKLLSMMDMDSETWSHIILLKAAEERGIKVADVEVIQYIRSIPFFQRDGEFDKRLYVSLTKSVFRREAREFEEGLRDQIKIMKLFAPHLKSISFTDETIRREYERRNQKLQASYVLISPDSFAKDMTADDKELTAFFDGHKNEFMEPESMNATVITVPLDARASDEEKKKAQDTAEDMIDKLAAGADAASVAKNSNATLKETGFFSMDNPSPEVPWSLELLQGMSTAKAGDVLGPVETDKGYRIVRITDKKASFLPEFDRIRDKIKAAVIREKATRAASEKAAELQKTLAAKVEAGADFTLSAKELSLDAKQTPFFGMGDYIPEIGISDDFTTAAFHLNKDRRLSDVVLTARGPAIIHWIATQPIDEKKFEEVKKDFEETLFGEERVRVMNEVIQTLRDKAKLESYLEKISADQKNAMEKLRVK